MPHTLHTHTHTLTQVENAEEELKENNSKRTKATEDILHSQMARKNETQRLEENLQRVMPLLEEVSVCECVCTVGVVQFSCSV
jgi:biotin synthase-related radical SAM superfamily protein